MLRKIIEYLRKKENIPIIDLTLDICSTSMYYFYIGDKKQLSIDKINAIKFNLGADLMTKEEIAEYQKEIHILQYNLENYMIEFSYFNKEVESLMDCHIQLLLEDKLVIDYLLLISLFCCYNRKLDELKEYYEQLSNLETYMSPIQKARFYFISIYKFDTPLAQKEEFCLSLHKIINENATLENKSWFIMGIATAYAQLKRNKRSIQLIDQALNLYRANDQFYGVIQGMNAKTTLLMVEGDYEEALRVALASLKHSETLHWNSQSKVAINSIIGCYTNMSDTDNVKLYLRKFQKLMNMKDSLQQMWVLIVSILSNLLLLDMNDEIYNFFNIIKQYPQHNEIPLLNNIMSYMDYRDEKEAISFLETKLLPEAFINRNLSLCRCLLKKCTIYFDKMHQYKKASLLKDQYIELFSELYK